LENSIKEKYNYGLTKSQAHKLNDSIQEDINKLTGKFSQDFEKHGIIIEDGIKASNLTNEDKEKKISEFNEEIQKAILGVSSRCSSLYTTNSTEFSNLFPPLSPIDEETEPESDCPIEEVSKPESDSPNHVVSKSQSDSNIDFVLDKASCEIYDLSDLGGGD
jgi:hypothetical protein